MQLHFFCAELPHLFQHIAICTQKNWIDLKFVFPDPMEYICTEYSRYNAKFKGFFRALQKKLPIEEFELFECKLDKKDLVPHFNIYLQYFQCVAWVWRNKKMCPFKIIIKSLSYLFL